MGNVLSVDCDLISLIKDYSSVYSFNHPITRSMTWTWSKLSITVAKEISLKFFSQT